MFMCIFSYGSSAVMDLCVVSIWLHDLMQWLLNELWVGLTDSRHHVYNMTSLTCQWRVCDVSVTCQWRVCEVSVMCLWRVSDVSVTCLWSVCDVSVMCQWRASDVSVTCQWRVVRGESLECSQSGHNTKLKQIARVRILRY